MRFCRCRIGDSHYASFIRALGSNTSLKVFELGFDAFASLGTPELSIDAIRELIHDDLVVVEPVRQGAELHRGEQRAHHPQW